MIVHTFWFSFISSRSSMTLQRRNQNPSSVRNNNETSEEVDERLKGIEPRMIELIENEVRFHDRQRELSLMCQQFLVCNDVIKNLS